MRGLYPIIDLSALLSLSLDPAEVARQVLEVRPALLELRAKHASAREVLATLRALRPLCDRAGTALFANDRPDLALLGSADALGGS